MKFLKLINEILMSIVLIVLIFSLIRFNFQKRINEDVNGDGKVNALDLLYVQKYIIEQGGYDNG